MVLPTTSKPTTSPHKFGLHNGHATLPSSDFSSKSTDVESVIAKIDGTPYFSMDVADLDVNEKEMNNSFKETEAKY
ncbi:hypothetical protein K435DRAFT_859104 [Dendrothele bispora CBS 962.96]|uniref:Uncharacterized protein n=1 Tax=Dendrothele bispora (strain CBS 962.96) TaxID=1314807 RepID=A0A4S8M196_DENBC|nr:hypothetical protein K435DRAFT_859104 [Dendrothele bispora CBS 962.96]